MAALFFPNAATLRLAVASGLIPADSAPAGPRRDR